MARERMVTRTVDVTTAEVMCLNITTAEVSIINFEVTGKFDNNDSIMKELKKAHENDTVKLVNINSSNTREVLYGMAEIDFIKHAKVLPPRSNQDSN